MLPDSAHRQQLLPVRFPFAAGALPMPVDGFAESAPAMPPTAPAIDALQHSALHYMLHFVAIHPASSVYADAARLRTRLFLPLWHRLLPNGAAAHSVFPAVPDAAPAPAAISFAVPPAAAQLPGTMPPGKQSPVLAAFPDKAAASAIHAAAPAAF